MVLLLAPFLKEREIQIRKFFLIVCECEKEAGGSTGGETKHVHCTSVIPVFPLIFFLRKRDLHPFLSEH